MHSREDDHIIEEALAFPHRQTLENTQRTLDAFLGHDNSSRLAQIAASTPPETRPVPRCGKSRGTPRRLDPQH